MTGVPCYLVDTNIMLRFLRGDHPEHSERSRTLFWRARTGEILLEVPVTTITETFHTLRSLYKTDKELAVSEVLKILDSRGVRLSAPHWFRDAINAYRSQSISFGDACIAAEARASGIAAASFDRDFDEIEGVERYEP